MKLLCAALAALLAFAPSGAKAWDATVANGNYKLVAGALVASTIFDGETTFAAIHNGAHEANGAVAPFVKMGRPAFYAMELGVDAGVLYFAYVAKRDGNKWWYVAPLILAVAHTAAGAWNLHYSVNF